MTFNYKKSTRAAIEKKNYRFWLLWGMGMYLIDKFPNKMMRKVGRIDKALKTLTVKEDVSMEKYLYAVEKISTSVAVLFITFLVATLADINQEGSKNQIKEVNRNKSTYQLEVEHDNGKKEDIFIELPEKQLSDEEKQEAIEDAKQLLATEMLGKNESLKNICYNLNFVSEIGEHKISVIWDISDQNIVNNEGKLGSDIPKEGAIVQIEATLMLKDKMEQVVWEVVIFPSKEQVNTENYLQQYVEEESVNSEKILLPEKVGNSKVIYRLSSDNYAYMWVVIGVVICVAIFFLKDKDLEKEVKERNKQLIRDYPEIVSKILLFYGAGLSMKSTFEEMVKEYRKHPQNYKYVYEEMELTLNKMRTGVSEVIAINEFGNRCGVHCYIKMSNIIEQNIRRGTKEITIALKDELSSAVNDRKNSALKMGSEISTKLLGPMLLMLMVAIAIVMVPAFMSMNL